MRERGREREKEGVKEVNIDIEREVREEGDVEEICISN